MIAELEDHLKRSFNQEKLNLIGKLIGEGWTKDVLRFSANVTQYREQVNCHIWAQFGEVRTELAQFSFEEFPWNGDVLVSGNVYVSKHYQGYGIGKLLNAERIEVAKASGASAIICTVLEANIPERKVLFANNWRNLGRFKSGYSNTLVEFWLKELK